MMVDRYLHLYCHGAVGSFEVAYQEEELESGDAEMGTIQHCCTS